MFKLIHRLAAYSAIVLSFAFIQGSAFDKGTELSGIVVDSKTHEPVRSAHVYVVVGEEEALTGKNGRFKFTTWKSLPLSINVTHQDYQKKVVTVADATRNIQISLVRNDSRD